MKKLIMIILVSLVVAGCDYVAPQVSKAKSEKEQVAIDKEMLEVQKDNRKHLESIASSLEVIANKYE